MRLMSLLSALAVTACLYLIIFERDRLLVFAGANAETPPAALTADAPAPQGISVVARRQQAQAIDSAVLLRGQTAAAREVTVAAETSGLVISEPLPKGSFVNAGDRLCTLDPGTRQANLAEARARLSEAQSRVPEAEAGVIEAEARLREAEINLNAARALSQDGFASETRVVGAQATMESAIAGVQRARTAVSSALAGIESAQASVASAEREITRLTITAPFAGLLETDTAELGALMQPGAPCATIIQLDPIRLVGFAPEADVARIKVGAAAGGRLAGQQEVAGAVTFLSRSADPVTRSFRVEVTVPNPDLAISDGLSAEIIVAAAGQSAHLVAQSTLTLNDAGTLGVRIVGPDMTAQFLPVTLLRDTAQGVWVAGLPDVVDLITIGQEFVIDGVPIVPSYQEVSQQETGQQETGQ
ncbi:efflux RND transporter periplasmic adaptor subunit [Yoonia vestfoldensis]|uniref:Toluene efflux pump periplasmic linker protein TtgG n=1 Tax=Yoonia vestfoldensis TaxID=245188 RepID=A0A1Y0ECF3_9RHOB|nr:efflux RND transporter periplasmic adaptor subunit [Yoonia vestfoldensis]ARU01071.1 toluene efflux pump periplasmic linker protein TtgG [Yoonia vestfoldensis]